MSESSFNIFNLMALLNKAAPMAPDSLRIMPDIDPHRIKVIYVFSIPKFCSKEFNYIFTIRDDWTEQYLIDNLDVVSKQLREGLDDLATEAKGEHSKISCGKCGKYEVYVQHYYNDIMDSNIKCYACGDSYNVDCCGMRCM